MNRLLTFVGLIIVVTIASTLVKFKSLPLSNEKFNLENKVEAHRLAVEEKAKLEEMRLAALNPKKVEETEVKEEIVVVLDTPELQKGFDLYQKCIVCHGKNGEGRKSQNAPRIGGQMDWYLEQELKKMQSGERANAVMNPYIRALTADDFKALAAYMSKLPWK